MLLTIRPPRRGIALTASSVVIMPVLGITKQRLGRRLSSGATAGEGIQNLMCAAQAAAVLLGLAVVADLACRMARRSGHRPGHRRVVCLGRPSGMARGRLLLALLSEGRRGEPGLRIVFAARSR